MWRWMRRQRHGEHWQPLRLLQGQAGVSFDETCRPKVMQGAL